MPKKKIITKAEAIALIIREARYRIGCEASPRSSRYMVPSPMGPAATRGRIGTRRLMTSSAGRPIARRRFARLSRGIGASTTLTSGTMIDHVRSSPLAKSYVPDVILLKGVRRHGEIGDARLGLGGVDRFGGRVDRA